MFLELIKELTETGFITDRLAMPEGPYTPGKPQTFMGVCKLPGEGGFHRRLDIKLYPTCVLRGVVGGGLRRWWRLWRRLLMWS